MAPCVTLDLYARDRKQVRTNPMLHEEPYINCFDITRSWRERARCLYKMRTTELFTF